MTLASGTYLGRYEILSPLGSGGMGEVYAARDPRLDRRVAIKISKAQFSERFEREARAAAALNHPHICQLYDVGPNYLVMELVEGAPVGPVANARELLDVATQMSDGLVAAHAVGIVHRDIKPSNVLVTSTGQVKILDFGLATLSPAESSASAVTQAVVTEAGTTIGTAAYMSPEQARGESLDVRTDLWSMGVVLYEIATGTRPFEGPTSAVVFEQLLSKTPTPVRQRNPKIPVDLERIIERLLEKDRETRYQSAADVRADLKRIHRETDRERSGAISHHTPRASKRTRAIVALAGAVIIMLALAAGVWRFRQPDQGRVASPSEYVQLTDFSDAVIDPSLSPDGRMVTFIRSDSEFPWKGDVYVKLLSGGDAVRLTSAVGTRYAPVFTPDGSRIAFTQVTRTDLGRNSWDTWTIPIGGGEQARMLPNAAGLVWIDNQHVLFSEIKGTGLHMGIVTATASRSEQREIYFPGHERAMAHYSYLSPDRRWVLISEMDGTTAFQPCRLAPFDGSSPGRHVGPQGACTGTAWSPDGRWMYFTAAVGGTSHVWRQSFPDGQPEQITFGPGEEFGVSVASDGASLVTAMGQQRSAIWFHDDTGERQVTTEGVAVSPQLSLDARRLYYLVRPSSTTSSSFELRSLELSSGRSERLITDRSVTQFAVSDDEKEVAFSTLSPDGVSEIWLAEIDRSTPPRRIAQKANAVFFAGSGLIFLSLEDKQNFIERIGKDGNGRRRVLDRPILGLQGVSPDGKWVTAGVSGRDESAPVELVVSVETGGSRVICGRCLSFWGPNGKWMYAVRGALGSQESRVSIQLGATQEPPLRLSALVLEAVPPGTTLIPHRFFAPGPNPSTYAFVRRDMQRNLYRIPLR